MFPVACSDHCLAQRKLERDAAGTTLTQHDCWRRDYIVGDAAARRAQGHSERLARHAPRKSSLVIVDK